MNQFDVLGVKISSTNLEHTSQTIEDWIQNKRKNYICIAPVSTVISCQEDEKYRSIINNAGMTTPDGMPLVWLGRAGGNRKIQRTYGPDLLLYFCNRSQQKRFRHYFYGGSKETMDALLINLKKKFPNLNIVGHYAPPLRGVQELESKEVLQQMNDAHPDVLWIGLGSPKQDYWMHQHREELDVPVMIGVGAAFDFIAGTKKQAPRWMQRSGLEWLFRLCLEPKRLWRRYLIGNSKFIYLLIKEKLLKRKIN